MKVSIVTTTFNSAATLQNTINSVAIQNYPEIEYIIIDGGSTDGTVDLIKSNLGIVHHWISEPDQGMYDGMNKGIKMASGDIIAIINSDDFYAHSGVIKWVVEQFKRTKVDSVYGDIQYVKAQNAQQVTRQWVSGAYHRHNFLFGWMPPHPAFFVRRAVYESFGLFDTRLQTSADYELMLRFLYIHRVTSKYLPKLLVCMRTGGASNRSWVNRLRANWEDRLAWKINGLRPYFFTTTLKPVRKIRQFFFQQHLPLSPIVIKRHEKV